MLQKAIEKMRIADNIQLKAPENLIHTLGAINDPPPPPEGSGCDNFCGQGYSDPEPDEMVFLFGNEPTYGYRWYLQQLHTTRDHWTRIGFTANKGKATCTENLIIGVVSESVASDPDLFLDVNNWEPLWAGQPYRYISLSSDALPNTSTYYWIGVDVDYDYTAAEGLMLVMLTYEPDDHNGWRSGANTSGNCFPCWYGPLYGTEWAWTPTTGGLALMSLVHTEPGGALVNGFGKPENISLPATAQNNVDWPWSFDLYNALAGFCGCPETLWFKMWQLDGEGGSKVGDPIFEYEVDLPCGYYVHIEEAINFNDMGGYPFYGLLETGHKDGTTYVIDVANSFDVWINCTEGAWGCDENDDKWVCTNGAWVKQTPSPHPDCINTYDCYKCDNPPGPCVLHTGLPNPCDEITTFTTKTACETATNCSSQTYDCYKCDNPPGPCVLHTGLPNPCDEVTTFATKAACEAATECSVQPEICDWIDAQGGPSALTIEDIFVIIDSYLYETPPSGYTFIPTVQNVSGVINYYLGFDGDAKTGCDYF